MDKSKEINQKESQNLNNILNDIQKFISEIKKQAINNINQLKQNIEIIENNGNELINTIEKLSKSITNLKEYSNEKYLEIKKNYNEEVKTNFNIYQESIIIIYENNYINNIKNYNKKLENLLFEIIDELDKLKKQQDQELTILDLSKSYLNFSDIK